MARKRRSRHVPAPLDSAHRQQLRTIALRLNVTDSAVAGWLLTAALDTGLITKAAAPFLRKALLSALGKGGAA